MDNILRWQKEHADRVYRAAGLYLDLGWSFFPVDIGSKTPLVKWTRFQYAPTTPDEVEEWFHDGVLTASGSRVMQFNLGLATGALSGVVVVDCDSEAALAQAASLGLTSPFRVNTRKGAHFYWAHPRGGATFPNRAGGNPGLDLQWPAISGLDFRGDGGYVVLPPSVSRAPGRDDVYYEWDSSCADLDDLDPLIPAYRWRTRFFPRAVEQLTEAEIATMMAAGQLPFTLAGVQPQGETRPSVATELASLGRQLTDGDGRNMVLTRFVGELVADGASQDEIEQQVDAFQTEHFDVFLPAREVATIIHSIRSRDRRMHPERYAADGALLPPPPKAPPEELTAPLAAPVSFRFIGPSDVAAIRQQVGDTPFSMYPCLPTPSILQIYGFSGHGKSLVAGHLTYALASGQNFGPYECHTPGRVLYLDYENGLSTIADRLDVLNHSFPKRPADSEFCYWTPAYDEDMTLNSAAGLPRLMAILDRVRPRTLVVDTVRTAFIGFEENRAESWATVNKMALALRNYGDGMNVILMHHANKPQDGSSGRTSGREAGSTNQLTTLETQMRVTLFFDETDEGEKLAEETYGVVDADSSAKLRTLVARREQELNNARSKPVRLRLRTSLKVTYGKVRSRTDSHRTALIGFCDDQDGYPHFVASRSLRDAVLSHMAARPNETPEQVAANWRISVSDVRRWANRGGLGEAPR